MQDVLFPLVEPLHIVLIEYPRANVTRLRDAGIERSDPQVVRNRLSKFVYTEGDPVTTRDSEEVLLESDERPEYLHKYVAATT